MDLENKAAILVRRTAATGLDDVPQVAAGIRAPAA